MLLSLSCVLKYLIIFEVYNKKQILFTYIFLVISVQEVMSVI